MWMTNISRSLKFEQNFHPFTWWKKNCINISDKIVLLPLLLSQLFPMLIFVHLMYHLNFILFSKFPVWIMNSEFVCLSLISLVLNWNGHEVYISRNHWHLDRVWEIASHHVLNHLILFGLSDHFDLLNLLIFSPVWLSWVSDDWRVVADCLSHRHLPYPINSELLSKIWIISWCLELDLRKLIDNCFVIVIAFVGSCG